MKSWILQQRSQWAIPFLRFFSHALIHFAEQPISVIDQRCEIHRKDWGQRCLLTVRILWLCTCFQFDATVFDSWTQEDISKMRHSLQREELSTILQPKDEFDLFSVSFHVSCIKMMNDIFGGFLPQRLLELPGEFFLIFSVCKRISGRCFPCPDGPGCHGSQQGLHKGCKGVKPLLNWEKVTVASTRRLKVTSQLGLSSVDVELYSVFIIMLLLSAGLAM